MRAKIGIPATTFASPSTTAAQPARFGSGRAGDEFALPRSGGEPLRDPLRSSMEKSFGHDFTAVRVHRSERAAQLGAVAVADGDNLHFAPGRYQPTTDEGRKVIGHELTHVVQQRQELFRGADGAGVLEEEARRLGERAASGALCSVHGAARSPQLMDGTNKESLIEMIREELVFVDPGPDEINRIADYLIEEYDTLESLEVEIAKAKSRYSFFWTVYENLPEGSEEKSKSKLQRKIEHKSNQNKPGGTPSESDSEDEYQASHHSLGETTELKKFDLDFNNLDLTNYEINDARGLQRANKILWKDTAGTTAESGAKRYTRSSESKDLSTLELNVLKNLVTEAPNYAMYEFKREGKKVTAIRFCSPNTEVTHDIIFWKKDEKIRPSELAQNLLISLKIRMVEPAPRAGISRAADNKDAGKMREPHIDEAKYSPSKSKEKLTPSNSITKKNYAFPDGSTLAIEASSQKITNTMTHIGPWEKGNREPSQIETMKQNAKSYAIDQRFEKDEKLKKWLNDELGKLNESAMEEEKKEDTTAKGPKKVLKAKEEEDKERRKKEAEVKDKYQKDWATWYESLPARYEWLHIIGSSLGGPNVVGNLVAGSYDANTKMIPFEHKIANLGLGKSTYTKKKSKPANKDDSMSITFDKDHPLKIIGKVTLDPEDSFVAKKIEMAACRDKQLLAKSDYEANLPNVITKQEYEDEEKHVGGQIEKAANLINSKSP